MSKWHKVGISNQSQNHRGHFMVKRGISPFDSNFDLNFGPSVLRAPAEQTKVATVLGN